MRVSHRSPWNRASGNDGRVIGSLPLARGVRISVRIVAAVILVALSARPIVRARASGLVFTAPEAVVIDGWTGHTLFARHANSERFPASTVKIMTALVVLNRHVRMNHMVVVSPLAAAYGGSTAGLYAGERMSVWNLLHGMLLPSGNDAAVALAQGVAGSLPRFVALMNAEALHLHLWHTHYLSPNGFDITGQVTTAHDLAALTRVAMQHLRFQRVVGTRSWTVRSPTGHVVHHWVNLNRLLWSSRAVDGVKTGTTPGAGACLVSSARSDGRWVIAVNMGSTEFSRFTDGETLLNYGLEHASRLPSTR